ncbi:hypothetical protein A1O7_09104 [Cladophialophora yegresii CBS 114405]|uniref:Uncharacterized protein n=1 Tax=Cladophialophora yegresii CBS 114405 TaxID=1182544 RepID=W9VKY4_9EURO|nr:uncharacterized protein A1O7_09104 [Cladophialophora yegresii CBS 114405]EXJ56173.1 hypothetical protein A1O7_09104 [Cladophialophora yegresii CBS 114405]
MDLLRLGTVVITGAAAGTSHIYSSEHCDQGDDQLTDSMFSDAESVIACLFAQYGCKQIYLGGSRTATLDECRRKILAVHPSVQVFVRKLDQSDEGDVDTFFASVVQSFTRIDFAVNLVCQDREPQATVDISAEDYARSYTVYQRGAFLIQRALLRQLLKQEMLPGFGSRGSIVNVVELGATASLADRPLAAAVANAIVGLSKTDAFDYATDAIRINCIAADEALKLQKGIGVGEKALLRSMEGMRSVANATAWLSSPGSGWLTGLVVPVDKGRNLNCVW